MATEVATVVHRNSNNFNCLLKKLMIFPSNNSKDGGGLVTPFCKQQECVFVHLRCAIAHCVLLFKAEEIVPMKCSHIVVFSSVVSAVWFSWWWCLFPINSHTRSSEWESERRFSFVSILMLYLLSLIWLAFDVFALLPLSLVGASSICPSFCVSSAEDTEAEKSSLLKRQLLLLLMPFLFGIKIYKALLRRGRILPLYIFPSINVIIRSSISHG